MQKYILEFADNHQKVEVFGKKEAIEMKKSLEEKFGVNIQLYPEEPEEQKYSTCSCCGWTLKNGECDACGQHIPEKQPFPGMCEIDGCKNPAIEGDFICEEHFRQMMDKMEGEK